MECSLRKWEPEDAAQLALALNNKKVQDNLRDGLPFPYTENDAKAYISEMQKADKTTTFAFAITVVDTVVGSIGIFRKKNIHARTAELGYFVAEPYWGQGIGTSAVRKACGHVFRNSDIIRIFAEPFACNAASCRVLEKSCFVCEGTMRSNAVKNGQILDMKLYALVRNTLPIVP